MVYVQDVYESFWYRVTGSDASLFQNHTVESRRIFLRNVEPPVGDGKTFDAPMQLHDVAEDQRHERVLDGTELGAGR